MSERREHSHIPVLKREFAEGRIDRREFLRYSTLLGLSATAAYAFVGKVTGESMVQPARAQEPVPTHVLARRLTEAAPERASEMRSMHATGHGQVAQAGR